MMNQLTVAQLLRALSCHRVKALLAGSLFMLIVPAAFLGGFCQHGSEGIRFVRLGRPATATSLTRPPASAAVQHNRTADACSVIKLVSSHPVVESAVYEIGADRKLEPPLEKWLKAFRSSDL